VRTFKDRMDLLRAVIVGASGTPYHDGLFFFDLQLPPSFPATPLLVSYRSFGLRVNPNLCPSGTVCLSLLNTFGGKGTELWSPEASSILQVVGSIQYRWATGRPGTARHELVPGMARCHRAGMARRALRAVPLRHAGLAFSPGIAL
jgi:ubiquitin-conjugating enzyme E2 O